VTAVYRSGPIAVRDAKGTVRGQITDLPENVTILNLDLDADHLLIRYYRTGPGGRGGGLFGMEWRRYDLLPEIHEVEHGESMIGLRKGQDYLIEYPAAGARGGTRFGFGRGATPGLPTASFFAIRDAKTGAKRFRVEEPDRLVRFDGFDPAGKTYLMESVDRKSMVSQPLSPVSTSVQHQQGIAVIAGGTYVAVVEEAKRQRTIAEGRIWPVRIHVRDAATHRDLQKWEIGVKTFAGVVAPPEFSPDGRHILFRYDAYTDERPLAVATFRRPVEDRVWVARPDGTGERELVVANRQGSGGQRRFGIVWLYETRSHGDFPVSPDGRHVAVPADGEVQIWDLETGRCVHHLAGHTGYDRSNIELVYSSDGSRLFSVEGGGRGGPLGSFGQAASKPQIHVWDPVGGRELLTLDHSSTGRSTALRAEFEEGNLLLQTVNGRRTLDGSPEPK
jgi:hypothetical protein